MNLLHLHLHLHHTRLISLIMASINTFGSANFVSSSAMLLPLS
jgi:hypothetical protein